MLADCTGFFRVTSAEVNAYPRGRMSRSWWKLVSKSRRARQRAGDAMWAAGEPMRAMVRRRLRAGTSARMPRWLVPAGGAGRILRPVGGSRRTAIAVLAVSPFAIAAGASLMLLPQGDPRAAPDSVKVAGERAVGGPEATPGRAEARRSQAPQRPRTRARTPALAPAPVSAAGAPGPPSAPESSRFAAADEPEQTSDAPAAQRPGGERPAPERPAAPPRTTFKADPAPAPRGRAPAGNERLRQPEPAPPAPAPAPQRSAPAPAAPAPAPPAPATPPTTTTVEEPEPDEPVESEDEDEDEDEDDDNRGRGRGRP
jgi:hypothetical protein